MAEEKTSSSRTTVRESFLHSLELTPSFNLPTTAFRRPANVR
jgi:hypothetical protein